MMVTSDAILAFAYGFAFLGLEREEEEMREILWKRVEKFESYML